jgi:vanillate O-demethylase monooxygenase subunit
MPVRLLGQDLVVARLGATGEVRAFADECPHRLAPLSAGAVEDGCLRCPYHGWRFAPDGVCTLAPTLGAGAPLPARARLSAVARCVEHQGLVWVALEEPDQAEPPSWDRWGFPVADLEVMSGRGVAGLLIDNFFDEAHFPFVHEGTIGAVGEPEVIGPYDLDRQGLGFTAVRSHRFANFEDPGVQSGLRPLEQTRTMAYAYQAPLFCTLLLSYAEAGSWQSIRYAVTPVDEHHVVAFMTLAAEELVDPVVAAQRVAFETKIVGEDLALQAILRHTALPLDLTREVHVKTDRVTLELRRVLAELVGPERP